MITKIFERVRRKAEQRAGDSFSQYWTGIVARLAAGEELDPEAVVAAAESVGRSPEQVEQDLDLFRRRQQMVTELASVEGWQREAQRLQALIDRQTAELNEAQSRLGKAIAEAYSAKTAIESRINGTVQYPTELANTCPNPALTVRESELIGQRKELLDRRRPLIESVADSGPGSLGSALRHAESQLEQFSDQAARGDTDSRQHVSKLKDYIVGYQARIKTARQSLSDIDESIAQLDRELAQIQNLKLQP